VACRVYSGPVFGWRLGLCMASSWDRWMWRSHFTLHPATGWL